MPTSPPDNAGYMIAAYLVTAVIVLGYSIATLVRARRAIAGQGEGRSDP